MVLFVPVVYTITSPYVKRIRPSVIFPVLKREIVPKVAEKPPCLCTVWNCTLASAHTVTSNLRVCASNTSPTRWCGVKPGGTATAMAPCRRVFRMRAAVNFSSRWRAGGRRGRGAGGRSARHDVGRRQSHAENENEDGGGDGCVVLTTLHPTPYEGSWRTASCNASYAFFCMLDPRKPSERLRLHVGSVAGATDQVHCVAKKESTWQTRANLLGHYLLYEDGLNGKTFHDKSDKGNDVEAKGATTFNWVNVVKNSRTLQFDGSFHLQYRNVYDFQFPTLTLAVWVNAGNSSMRNKVVLSKSYSKTTNPTFPLCEWALAYNSRGFICFIINSFRVCDKNLKSQNEWAHVAGVYDGSKMKLFLKGNFVGDLSVPSPAFTHSNETFVVVGGENRDPVNHENDFFGSIDDVLI
ncbi:hypothetical protein LSM04_005304 [Trypanosoma melophagium]|uniref:uncharacterized protein n=1 Tax=Trypanosoma melophagium TaxID=715481 RepID=UPI00351A9791|nr:hypothetical protein LSM04_005304 [Trypanosoma melophagium]